MLRIHNFCLYEFTIGRLLFLLEEKQNKSSQEKKTKLNSFEEQLLNSLDIIGISRSEEWNKHFDIIPPTPTCKVSYNLRKDFVESGSVSDWRSSPLRDETKL